jgi:hypothetical protein
MMDSHQSPLYPIITAPGNWRPLNGLDGVIGMDFYPTRLQPRPRNGTSIGPGFFGGIVFPEPARLPRGRGINDCFDFVD